MAVLLFSKLNSIFVGYFDPEKFFLDDESKCFRGNLTDVSAETKPLVGGVPANICSLSEIYMQISETF